MRKLLLGAPLLLFFSTAGAVPMNYTFSQGGFGAGATVTGSFTAEDLDSNGQISSFQGEVTAFGMAFSGNAVVPAFTLGLSDLFGLVYDMDGDIGDGLALDIEGIGATGSQFEYIAGPGPFNLCNGSNSCGQVQDLSSGATDTSTQIVVVTTGGGSVPEPATTALIGLGLAGIGFARRKGRA